MAQENGKRAQGDRFDTVVVGGGQAGLIVGRELQKRNADFVILDASARVGDAWRNRWDSLRLFTQAFMNGLPDMDFPGAKNEFVGKDEVADFLERYAVEMELPVRSGVRVNRVARNGQDFTIETTDGTLHAANVVVAMADYQKPRVPPFAEQLDPAIRQLHSTEYRNPAQLKEGPVLVVGLGNSGADIAYDVAATHETTVAGVAKAGAVPFKLEGWFGRHFGTRLVRFAMVKVLNMSTPMGRKVRPKMLASGPPLVRIRPKELKKAGVRTVGRIEGVDGGKPVAADGEVIDVPNVIWATGFSHGFDWIDLPVFDENGAPIQERGVVASEPGLYFLGLFFLHAVWSETITGVQPDARHVADHVMSRMRSNATLSAS